jgi:hypothetical protein
MFATKELNDTDTFFSAGISNEKTIHVIKSNTASGISVIARGPKGEMFNLFVSSTDTILKLKEQICAKSAIPPNAMTLIASGRILEDDTKTIQDYRIQKGTQIQFGLRLVGGK